MADQILHLRPQASSTAGTCMPLVDNSAQSPIGAIEETIARMSVAPYSTNRGRFLPEPLLSWTLTVTGGALDDGTGTVSEAANDDAEFFDPADAGPSWRSLSGESVMSGQPESIAELLPASVSDRRCGLLLPAMRLEPGGTMSLLVHQTERSWFAVAARPLLGASGDQQCRLVSMQLLTRIGVLWIHAELDGGTLVVRSDTIEYISMPVSAVEAVPLVCAIGMVGGYITVIAHDQLGTRRAGASAAGEYVTVAGYELGGQSSGGMMVYGAATAPTDDAGPVVRLLGDVVSC